MPALGPGIGATAYRFYDQRQRCPGFDTADGRMVNWS